MTLQAFSVSFRRRSTEASDFFVDEFIRLADFQIAPNLPKMPTDALCDAIPHVVVVSISLQFNSIMGILSFNRVLYNV